MAGPFLWAGAFAKSLKSQLNLNDDIYILNGSDDPTSVAKTAPRGSIYFRDSGSVGEAYIKQDDGSSTNWTKLQTNVPSFDAVLFVDKDGNDSTGNGSAASPFLTIQKAIDVHFPGGAPASAADERKRRTILVGTGAYDEDLTLPAAGFISILALGEVTLGDAASANLASTTPRNINWAINGALGFSQVRPSLVLGGFTNIDTSSTHIGYAGSITISGDIVVTSATASTIEMQLNGVRCEGTLDCSGKTGITNVYTDKCYFGSSSTWGQASTNLNIANYTEFNGLLSLGQLGRMIGCEVKNGITVGSLITSIPPYGMFDCVISGTFTGPAASYRINGATKKMSNPSLSGGATETLLDYSDEDAQDAVGGILVDSSTIDLNYDDGANQISAEVIDGSITLDKLDPGVTQFLGRKRITVTIGRPSASSDIQVGRSARIPISFAANITAIRLVEANEYAGSIVIDIKKGSTFASATSICASAKPTLSSSDEVYDNTLTGWTTALVAGDMLWLNVDSCDGCYQVVLTLEMELS